MTYQPTKSCLTAKERVVLAFQHREADRVPLYAEARNIGFIERITGKKLQGSKEAMERITADAYGTVGIDLMRTLMTPRWGIEKGPSHDVQYDGYLKWKVGGEQALTLAEAQEYLKRRAESGQDPHDRAVEMIREVERVQAILGNRTLFMPIVPASCLESIYHSIGIENFAFIMCDCPELLDAALQRNMEQTIQMVEVINNIYDGPVIHCCDDLGMKNTTIVSPQWLREHVFPSMKAVVDKIKEGGKYFSFHSCGNVTAIVPDLIDVGIDALDPIEITAGMDLAELKRDYGDRLVLIGNANANIIQMGSPDDVRAEVRRCCDEAAHGGGYFLSGGITQATPTGNVVAYFDEAKRYVVRN
ncbi:MAG TPA: hypothetical protein DCX07_14030 [Phycisphaerales bacterium]|nr:hypothetical protein [Phycisphaerales bacterium]